MKKTLLLLGITLAVFGCKKPSVAEDDLLITKDSLEYYKQAFKAANYFSIEDNQNARDQFGGVDVDEAMKKVQYDLRQLEKENGANALLPIALEGERTIMNKAAVLNHKWIIMDYFKKDEDEDITEVGEIIIEYTFHSDRPCDFFVLSKTTY